MLLPPLEPARHRGRPLMRRQRRGCSSLLRGQQSYCCDAPASMGAAERHCGGMDCGRRQRWGVRQGSR